MLADSTDFQRKVTFMIIQGASDYYFIEKTIEHTAWK